MATFEYKTWETINLPVVSGDTSYLVYDHLVTLPDKPRPTYTTGLIYSGLVLDGYGVKNLDEILSQYVHPKDISFTSSVQADNDAYTSFYVYYSNDNWNTWTYDNIIMLYDWGYEDTTGAVLSHPVTNLVDCRQWFLYSIKAGDPDTSTTIFVDLDGTPISNFTVSGYTHYNYVSDLSSWTYPGEFNYAYSYDFYVDTSLMIPGTFNTIHIGPSKYIVANTCYKYCVYYVNEFGGWDSLLFAGKALQKDALSRLSYKKNYIAGDKYSFGKVDYTTNIDEAWELVTGYIDDLASARMRSLLASNKIWVHDLETGVIKPANITNTTCEHKNYKSNGRKMSTYTINLSNSQRKYRV